MKKIFTGPSKKRQRLDKASLQLLESETRSNRVARRFLEKRVKTGAAGASRELLEEFSTGSGYGYGALFDLINAAWWWARTKKKARTFSTAMRRATGGGVDITRQAYKTWKEDTGHRDVPWDEWASYRWGDNVGDGELQSTAVLEFMTLFVTRAGPLKLIRYIDDNATVDDAIRWLMNQWVYAGKPLD